MWPASKYDAHGPPMHLQETEKHAAVAEPSGSHLSSAAAVETEKHAAVAEASTELPEPPAGLASGETDPVSSSSNYQFQFQFQL